MTLDLGDIRSAWEERRDSETSDRAYRGDSLVILRELAKGAPVTPARAAELIDQLSEEAAVAMFQRAARRGVELDADGAIIGNALTLRETPHRLTIDGTQLYAWCAFDTLFLPMLLGAVAHVETRSPTSGATLRLTVGPDGVRDYNPKTMRASIVIPGTTPGCETTAATGPRSAICSQMHFFETEGEAADWASAHQGIEIVTIEDAASIAGVFGEQPRSDCC